MVGGDLLARRVVPGVEPARNRLPLDDDVVRVAEAKRQLARAGDAATCVLVLHDDARIAREPLGSAALVAEPSRLTGGRRRHGDGAEYAEHGEGSSSLSHGHLVTAR